MLKTKPRYWAILPFLFLFFSVKGQNENNETLWFIDVIPSNDTTWLFPYDDHGSGLTTTDPEVEKVIRKSIRSHYPVNITFNDQFHVTEATLIELSKMERLAFFMPAEEINLARSFKGNLKQYEKKYQPGKGHYDTLKPTITTEDLAIRFQQIKEYSCDSNLNCSCDSPCITFRFKVNGCFARAHWVRNIFESKWGYLTKKVYVKPMPKSNGYLLAKNDGHCGPTTFEWSWHIANYITEIDSNGNEINWVLDPAMAEGLYHPMDWVNSLKSHPDQELDWLVVSSDHYGINGRGLKNKLSPRYMTHDHDYFKTKAFLSEHCKYCNETHSMRSKVYKMKYQLKCLKKKKQ